MNKLMNKLIETLGRMLVAGGLAVKFFSRQGGRAARLTSRVGVPILCIGWLILGQNAGAASAPTITTQPANQVLAVGGTMNLSVTATGDAPLTYQWLKDGSMIAGATSSTLNVANAGVTSSGVYYVVVANVYGINI